MENIYPNSKYGVKICRVLHNLETQSTTDPEVKQNGGIHVIQTFVAENVAEEIQV